MGPEETEKQDQNLEPSKSSLEDIGFSVIIVMLLIILAPLFDIIGLILFILSLFGIGIPASFVLDIVAGFTIGILLYFFNQSTAGIERGIRGLMQFIKKIAPRFGAALGAESVPFLGDILPGWTILVIIEIVSKIIK